MKLSPRDIHEMHLGALSALRFMVQHQVLLKALGLMPACYESPWTLEQIDLEMAEHIRILEEDPEQEHWN